MIVADLDTGEGRGTQHAKEGVMRSSIHTQVFVVPLWQRNLVSAQQLKLKRISRQVVRKQTCSPSSTAKI